MVFTLGQRIVIPSTNAVVFIPLVQPVCLLQGSDPEESNVGQLAYFVGFEPQHISPVVDVEE